MHALKEVVHLRARDAAAPRERIAQISAILKRAADEINQLP
jgi:hypothetical protein